MFLSGYIAVRKMRQLYPLICRLAVIQSARWKRPIRFIFEADPHIEGFYSVKRGLSAKAQAPAQPLEAALKNLQKELHICVAEHATSHTFVHAGVVAWKDRTLILPGFSHAGKSSALLWSLVQAGAVYYSDEYAIFDEHGSVYPFALPIGLRLNHGERRFIRPDNVSLFAA